MLFLGRRLFGEFPLFFSLCLVWLNEMLTRIVVPI